MKLIQRGNRQLRVDDVRAAELLKAGYVEVDEDTGKPIKVETEQEKAEKAIKAENEALKAENAALKEQLAALQTNETMYTCPICGKEYKTEEGLTKHIAEKHPDGAGE